MEGTRCKHGNVHSACRKKTPSHRRRDSQRKHDYYVERHNNKQCTNIGTMTDNIDTKMQHVKKIKWTSQETQTEQVSERHIQVELCTNSKSKENDIDMMRNSSAEARNIMETSEKVTFKAGLHLQNRVIAS